MITPEFSIVHTIGPPLPDNTIVKKWPLHMTIIPPFELEKQTTITDITELIKHIGSTIGPIKLAYGELRSGAIPLEVGGGVSYGPENDIPAVEVQDPSNKLHELHNELLSSLGELGIRDSFFNPDWSGANYHPHATTKSGDILDRPFFCTTASLFKKTPRQKRILTTIDLVNNQPD